jgi:hypothetical protein
MNEKLSLFDNGIVAMSELLSAIPECVEEAEDV